MEIQTNSIARDSQYINKNVNENQTKVISEKTLASNGTSLADLIEGQYFKGTILDVRNNDSMVKILLSNDQTINASISGKMNLNIGEKVVFQVKEHFGDKLVITPTAYGDASGELISKSLLGASLPETPKNIALVKELINYKQPIDKDTVINLFKQTLSYPEANISSLVEMNAHDLPVSKENIQQYEAYKNSMHSFTSGISSMADDVTDLLANSSLEYNNSVTDTTELFGKLMDAFFTPDTLDSIVNQNESGKIDISISDDTNRMQTDMQNLENIEILDDNEAEMQKSFTDVAKEMLVNAKTNEEFKAAITYINENIGNKEELATIFNSTEIKESLKDKIMERLSLKPEMFEDDSISPKQKIDALYERLDNIEDKLSKALENNPKGSENLLEHSKQFSQNLNFMGDLNNLASYVQIPIKLSKEEANAELYVYNKKRGKVKPGETLTAFLHLDLENLGATDINVSLTNSHVTIKFSMTDYMSARLIDKHLSELEEKLVSQGYSVMCSSETVKQIEEESPARKILKNDEDVINIKKYLFDIRA
ncbi:MAG: flagellar hook-length control protein FliK [Lachnospiraceae bacterium]|nr:flagellar hook-length control protein FliK [Lachnospiraceae bacterium]